MDPPHPPSLRILAAFHTLFYSPLHVADRLGLFTQEGLDARIACSPQASETPDRLLAGEADLAVTGPMRTYVAADGDSPRRLVNIAEVNSRDGFFLLARRPAEPFRWPDLLGKRVILFAEAPTPWMCLLDVLRRHGVDPQRVAFLRGLRLPDALEAFRAGQAEYLQTAQPMAEALLQEGAAHLVAAMGEAVGHIPYTAFVVTPQVRTAQPALCQRAVTALARAQRWMAGRDPQGIADLIAPDFPEIPPPLASRVVARYQAMGMWPCQPVLAREPFERLGGILAAGGLIRRAASYEALVDNTFAEAAVRALGPRGGPGSEGAMIRQCDGTDFEAIYAIINDAAQAYRGVIPADCWKEPYMPRQELREEMDHGVLFWGYEDAGQLVGVMGIQHVQDVTLIRHAYVRTARRAQGIGAKLLAHLRAQTSRPVLIGTWADATWAIRFYEKHGFRLVSAQEKARLLRTYWSVPDRQIETSVVLADPAWFAAR